MHSFLITLMVCFHCPTPIPIPIPIPIPMELASIVMCRTVSTEPTSIPMHALIPMPMGTVPILVPTSVLIRCNLTSFHCNFCIGIGPSGALLHTIGIGTIIGIGIRVRQWKHTISHNILLFQHFYKNATKETKPINYRGAKVKIWYFFWCHQFLGKS